MRIETKKGLTKLLERYQKANGDGEWILTILGCI